MNSCPTPPGWVVNRPAPAYHLTTMISPESLQIVLYPTPVLREQAQPIEQVTDEVRAIVDRMFELMHEAPGVGLAAPQVGLPWRLFVANPTGEPEDDRVFINPVLRDPTREMDEMEEGCLSLPHIKGIIRRPIGMTIDALDRDGQPFTITSREFDARVWQHEFDHLDGILILDRMPPIDRMANKKLVKELESARA